MKRGSLRKFRPDGHQGDGSGLRAVSKDIMKETIKGGITGFKRNSLFEKDHTMRLGVSNRGFKSRLKKRLGSELKTTERLKGCFGAQLIVSDLCIPMQLFTTGTTSIDFQVDAQSHFVDFNRSYLGTNWNCSTKMEKTWLRQPIMQLPWLHPSTVFHLPFSSRSIWDLIWLLISDQTAT